MAKSWQSGTLLARERHGAYLNLSRCFGAFYLVATPDVSDLTPLYLQDRVIQSEVNTCIASHLLKKVLAARIVIFQLFLELAIEVDGKLLEKHKRIWLLFQLRDQIDPQSGTQHPFLRVIQYCLKGASFDALDELLNRFTPLVEKYLKNPDPRCKHFIIGLDEAQHAIRLYPHSFTSNSSGDGKLLRSFLRQMVSVFSRVPSKLVVSCTSMSLEDLTDDYGLWSVKAYRKRWFVRPARDVRYMAKIEGIP
ncbi:hypothetical protein M413DRAFT_32015 [Hebeloma cylindrosporum]|uniref:Uncharacterized protein n=1 Tax=Hebeloma cylindrosporum TaxID=76867 RepID=A0A0C3BXI2_HEBCY|nr:hypothetical protein M413DRAFT_32015 [Hebeloma cylindrosporum h7]